LKQIGHTVILTFKQINKLINDKQTLTLRALYTCFPFTHISYVASPDTASITEVSYKLNGGNKTILMDGKEFQIRESENLVTSGFSDVTI